MANVSSTTNHNSVHIAAAPYLSSGTNSCSAVGSSTPTGSCSANNGSASTSGNKTSSTEPGSSGKSDSNFFTSLLSGILNFSGGGGLFSALTSAIPGLGMLITGLNTIFKSGNKNA